MHEDNEDTQEKHWYTFTFQWVNLGTISTGTTMIGWVEKYVNVPRIDWAKECANAPENSVMLCCSYLGCMTRSQMLGEK